MKLSDTVKGMNSEDYKERFIAEHQQIAIRCNGLKSMIEKWDKGELGFVPSCSRDLFVLQLQTMKNYMKILEIRATIEGIELNSI